jgi:PAS domain S-box-containing protein
MEELSPDPQTDDEIQLPGSILRALLNTMPVGVIVSDAEGHVLTNNAISREILGGVVTGDVDHLNRPYTTHKPDGTPFPPEEIPLRRAIAHGEATQDVEILIKRADGIERTILTAAAPVYDKAGRITNGIVVFQDITQRQKEKLESQRRARDLALLNQVGQTLAATLDLPQVLTGLLEATQKLITADGDSIWLLDDATPDWLVCQAAKGNDSGQSLVKQRLQIGEGIVGKAAQCGETQLVARMKEHARLSPTLDNCTGIHPGSMLVVPLRVRENIIGVLEVVSEREAHFDDHDRILLETLTSGASVAIDNARLYAAAQQTAAATERNHLAHELHDAVSQLLFSASVIAESLPRLWERNPERVRQGLAQLHQLTRGALAEMRTLLLELRPTALTEAALGDLLRQLVDAVRGRTRVQVALTVEGDQTLPADVQITLYRIAQEALNNVIKHARATDVAVSLINGADNVTMCVIDNGRGFDPATILPGHMGIGIMHERAEAVGISLDIRSQAGHGTEIVATWSISDEEGNR